MNRSSSIGRAVQPVEVPRDDRADSAVSNIGEHPRVGRPALAAACTGVVIAILDRQPATASAELLAVLPLPGGADLFGVFGRAHRREPSPPRRLPSRAPRRKRARARNRWLRPINEAERRYDFARRRELERIADRNHMRRLKRVFKGDAPSTSPWCTYVNEPMEPEELPDDWLPPRVCDPDEPPF